MSDHGFNLGGEQSGHIIISDFGFTGDGIIAALQILANFVETGAKTISSLCNTYEELPQSIFNIKYDDIPPFRKEDLAELTATIQKELGQTSRISIRKSGTEPVIRIMIEADSQQKIQTILLQTQKRLETLNKVAA
jgi:phosphoglucosamine mutase